MKPPPFRYARPETLDKVLHLLEEYDGGARVLAGGQSLIPILNFRLARPEVLVDIALVRTAAHQGQGWDAPHRCRGYSEHG